MYGDYSAKVLNEYTLLVLEYIYLYKIEQVVKKVFDLKPIGLEGSYKITQVLLLLNSSIITLMPAS